MQACDEGPHPRGGDHRVQPFPEDHRQRRLRSRHPGVEPGGRAGDDIYGERPAVSLLFILRVYMFLGKERGGEGVLTVRGGEDDWLRREERGTMIFVMSSGTFQRNG